MFVKKFPTRGSKSGTHHKWSYWPAKKEPLAVSFRNGSRGIKCAFPILNKNWQKYTIFLLDDIMKDTPGVIAVGYGDPDERSLSEYKIILKIVNAEKSSEKRVEVAVVAGDCRNRHCPPGAEVVGARRMKITMNSEVRLLAAEPAPPPAPAIVPR